MNYINADKNYMTDAEWIKYLEESVRELRKEKERLNKEKGRLKEFNIELNGEYKNSLKQIKEISNNYNELKEENEKLNLQIAELMGERDGKQMKIERLEERIKEHVPTQILADFRNKFKK